MLRCAARGLFTSSSTGNRHSRAQRAIIRHARMSVAVLFNLSDGLVLAVDSAVTVFDGTGIAKVFEDSEKLFQLSGQRIGIATYGMAGLEGRTIGSYLREFETTGNNAAEVPTLPISEVVERLRVFFMNAYVRFAEQFLGIPYDQIPDDRKGDFGLLVGGFSPSAFLSEAWEILIPWNSSPNSARQVFGPGQFGCAWFATSAPIHRYLKGIDRDLLLEWFDTVEKILGRPLTDQEATTFNDITSQHEYRLKTDSMPIQAGIDCARFLVSLVINHYRFASRDPIVGGKPKIGVVTYRAESFRLLD